jgi:hypothetical protein
MGEYRIDESFEIIGAFWRFSHPDETFTGTLISRKGRVEVMAAPSYEANLDGDAFLADLLAINTERNVERIPSICAFTTDKRCTLLNCLILDGPGLTGAEQRITATRYIPSRTVMGLHIESANALSIDSALVSFTKLHHLLPAPWLPSQMTDEGYSFSVPRTIVEVFKFVSGAIDANISCEVFAGGGTKVRKTVAIKSVPRIRITPRSPQSIDWFNDVAFRTENFFALFLGTSLSVKHIRLFQGRDEGWLVHKINQRQEKINLQLWVRCPFQIVSDALDKWLAVPEGKQPVERVVLGIIRKSALFAETEFLSLAQAIEGFGRIQFAYGKRERYERRSENRPHRAALAA